MKKVQILLSSYNGERFIKTQLDSLLAQTYPDVHILVRDDGSTDGTVALLQDYAEQHKNITYIAGENLGVQGSFFALMKAADLSADYFAFCDQDDDWLEDKIQAAVNMLTAYEDSATDTNKPLLYCGKPTLVDVDLQPLTVSIAQSEKRPGFGNALIENICYGCTTVINRALLTLANQYTPSNALMHDWWLYLTATCWGKVIYDSNSYLLYRQYEGNQVGTKHTYLKEVKYRLGLWKKRKGRFHQQAKEFFHFGEITNMPIPELPARLLSIFLEYPHSIKGRITILGCNEIYRQRPLDSLAVKLCLLLGLL